MLDQRDGLAGERLVDVDEPALPLDLAAAAHAAALGVVRTGRRAQHAVPAPGGGTVVLGRGVVIERGMGARNCRAVGSRGSGSAGAASADARRPFCCGLAGAMRSGRTPALIARTESRDSPPAPVEANGAPLSERSASGSHARERRRPGSPRHGRHRPAPPPGSAEGSGCAHPTGSRARTAPRRRCGTSP